MIRRLALVAVFLSLLPRCGGSTEADGVTAVRFLVSFDDAWAVTQLALESRDRTSTVPEHARRITSPETVLVLLRDDDANQPMDVAVWGLAGDERVARGKVTFTPTLHRAIDVPVVLTSIRCDETNGCTGPATDCTGAACAPPLQGRV